MGAVRPGLRPNDREGLKQALIQRGAKPAELVEAGLLISPESGGQPYDRFRDRLMFPILDARGRIVSFGGRAMNPDDRAKYLNGPESPLFHKGATSTACLRHGASWARSRRTTRPSSWSKAIWT